MKNELVTPKNDYLMVNPETLLIDVPATEEIFGVYHDNEFERKYFKCPRIVKNNKDLSECHIFINYVSASGKVGQYKSEDVKLAEDEDYITFSWDLTNNVFDENKDATIYFAVQAKTKTGKGVFGTRKAQGKVFETIDGTGAITEEYADIILYLIERMDNLEQGAIPPEKIQEAIDEYFKKHPIAFKETDPTVPSWAKQPRKPTYTASEVGAEPRGTVTEHNSDSQAHPDIRRMISELPGGGSGTTDYNDLENKPQINGRELYGNKTLEELGLQIPAKLPNPHTLTFTGAVMGSYDGSREVTINIPSGGGGTGATNYVTPEQFGAKGDGITDDTAAFQAAIDSKQPIKCRAGKFYKLPEKLVARNSVLYLDGNGSQLIGLQIDINSVDGTGWVDQYKSYEAVIKNCQISQNGNKAYAIFMAGPLRLENIDIVNYNEFLKMSANYLDNFSASGITHYVQDHTADYVTFNLMGGLGDKYLIERCHFVKVKAWGKQPITFLQCLNGGFFGRSSQANFIGCHLENFKCELEMSEARFIGCYIWANVNLLKDAVYDKCAFIVHSMTNNGRNDFRTLNTNDCKVYIHQNETTGYQTALELDDYKKNTNIPIDSEDQCIYFNSKGGQIKFDGQTGDYTYTVYPSVSPDNINGYGNANKFTHTVNILHNGSTPLFTANGYFKDMFYHVFRKNPDNTYAKAVIPYGYYIIDTGTSLNGILWEKVTSIPEIKENKAKLINGIYVSDNPSNVNGENVLVVNKSSGLVLVL